MPVFVWRHCIKSSTLLIQLLFFLAYCGRSKTSTASKPNHLHFRFLSHSWVLLLCEDKNTMSDLLISCLLYVWLVLYQWWGDGWLFQTTDHTSIQISFSHASCCSVISLLVIRVVQNGWGSDKTQLPAATARSTTFVHFEHLGNERFLVLVSEKSSEDKKTNELMLLQGVSTECQSVITLHTTSIEEVCVIYMPHMSVRLGNPVF